ncbi:MAG: M20 family metallo-hydrolase [Cytophagales bacterium]|nr:M20 family metallo-hydrolase [Cytophagales bacterium]
MTELYTEAVELLQDLIRLPSFSKEEDQTAEVIFAWLKSRGVEVRRHKNNVWAVNRHFDRTKPSVLLNSHHDTVRPNKGYTRDPFAPVIEDGKLYGLGSNDAGGSLVSLLALFVNFYEKENLAYNLIMTATAEEENSGSDGLESLLKHLPEHEFAVVGEPTDMHLAVAEKGLLVIDGVALGKSGHAAHNNTENALLKAVEDINWINDYDFEKESGTLGKVKMSVTQIHAGQQHNVVPASCQFVVDVRVNDCYSNREVFEIIDRHTKSQMTARSFRLNSSSIPLVHPLVQAGKALGRETYGSPTVSDQAVLSGPSLKLGVGSSLRSHSADEFVLLDEIKQGIELYIRLFGKIL